MSKSKKYNKKRISSTSLPEPEKGYEAFSLLRQPNPKFPSLSAWKKENAFWDAEGWYTSYKTCANCKYFMRSPSTQDPYTGNSHCRKMLEEVSLSDLHFAKVWSTCSCKSLTPIYPIPETGVYIDREPLPTRDDYRPY